MITYLRRSAANTVVETTDREKAIYFSINDGPLHPIDELDEDATDIEDEDLEPVENSRLQIVHNIPPASDKLPAPLPLPTMNENQEDEQPVVGNVLPLPKMTFDKPGQKKNKEKKQTANSDLPEPLPLPSMSFEKKTA